MKRFATVFSLLLALVLLASCGLNHEWKEHVNETFASVPIYKTGEVTSAQFGESCNIKILDEKYSHFVKYIDQLKNAGFEYYSISNIPENIELNAGQAVWRASKGDIFLQLIFSESGTENFDAFGCNVQIFGFSEDPWKDINTDTSSKKSEKKSKSKEKSSEDTSKTAEESQTKS